MGLPRHGRRDAGAGGGGVDGRVAGRRNVGRGGRLPRRRAGEGGRVGVLGRAAVALLDVPVRGRPRLGLLLRLAARDDEPAAGVCHHRRAPPRRRPHRPPARREARPSPCRHLEPARRVRAADEQPGRAAVADAAAEAGVAADALRLSVARHALVRRRFLLLPHRGPADRTRVPRASAGWHVARLDLRHLGLPHLPAGGPDQGDAALDHRRFRPARPLSAAARHTRQPRARHPRHRLHVRRRLGADRPRPARLHAAPRPRRLALPARRRGHPIRAADVHLQRGRHRRPRARRRPHCSARRELVGGGGGRDRLFEPVYAGAAL
mmetsp:Transcript_19174/g.56854  ORF Transcript_19174/g.56854 Transcript_19174/m.56854 type:complete len:322 (+) Transcript_19174:527-1492(+)